MSSQSSARVKISLQKQIKQTHIPSSERKGNSYQAKHKRKISYNETKDIEIAVFMETQSKNQWIDLWDKFKLERNIDTQNYLLEQIVKILNP